MLSLSGVATLGPPGASSPVTALRPSPADAQAAPGAEVRTVAAGLEVPWGVAVLPDGGALVAERDRARVVHVSAAGEVTEVGEVTGVEPAGEGGLLGIAVSPDFAADRYVYLYLTAAEDNRIVRARYEDGRLGEPEVVIDGLPKGVIHNGGRIAFGPDGMLYAGVGDAGQTGLAQDLGSLGGKILRLTPEGDPAPGNPFGTPVWSYGHRNVQGLAWDDAGRMFATEFGQNAWDEINRIEPGRNYGWPVVEGVGGDEADDLYTDPVVTWPTSEASPSGLAFADGSLWAAALRGQRLWELPVDADGTVGEPRALLEEEYGRLRTVVVAPEGPDASLWVATSNRDGRGVPAPDDDRILAVEPAPAS
ncbi:MAG TPA: PQQ-dependent sugar dehydrogenase [Acidimicrobiales bacterium]